MIALSQDTPTPPLTPRPGFSDAPIPPDEEKTMSKHTPGPWEIREETVGERIVARVIGAKYTGGHKPIATLHSGFTCSAEDARLIAASPDLLQACHDALRVVATLDPELSRKLIDAIGKTTAGGESAPPA